MCGIIGFLGDENAKNIIINGLTQLQNRGYDSAGFSLITDKINTEKYASCDKFSAIDKLKQSKITYPQNMCGIGHTRWATHGAKTDINSHPHLDSKNKISLVHNGIIENYKELKNFLIIKNYKFKSQTDTEIIVNLISYYYDLTNNFEKSIKKAISLLHGTWGLAIICIDYPNKLFLSKKW